jgi:TonB family protein
LDKRKKLKTQLLNYSIENVLRVRIEKSYRNDFDRYAVKPNELLIPNLPTSSTKPKLFKPGEKYLFYLDAITELKDGLVTFYIDPNGQTMPVSQAGDTIVFLERVHKLSLMREVLGYDRKDELIGGIIGGRAISLPKPEYPAEARTNKASESIHVYVLIDETGQVIRAKALCAQHADLALAAERAAMNAKYHPNQYQGNPIKAQGTITYNFTP